MTNRRHRILIIDGHEDVLMALERLLEDNGFSTVTAWSAREALDIVESVKFDLILVNEYLPDADAEDLLRDLSARRGPPPCFVMHPGASNIMESRKFRIMGAVGLISKNNHRVLLDTVRDFFNSVVEKRKAVGASR